MLRDIVRMRLADNRAMDQEIRFQRTARAFGVWMWFEVIAVPVLVWFNTHSGWLCALAVAATLALIVPRFASPRLALIPGIAYTLLWGYVALQIAPVVPALSHDVLWSVAVALIFGGIVHYFAVEGMA